jgi:hypothetical protein
MRWSVTRTSQRLRGSGLEFSEDFELPQDIGWIRVAGASGSG